MTNYHGTITRVGLEQLQLMIFQLIYRKIRLPDPKKSRTLAENQKKKFPGMVRAMAAIHARHQMDSIKENFELLFVIMDE